MCTFLLIRHAAHSGAANTLLGRLPGISLSEQGRAQAEKLAAQLSSAPLAAIHSSPRQRALETAWPIAQVHELNVTICDPLDELDYGDWTGENFVSLARDPRWRKWNDDRSFAAPPHGESMRAVQDRILTHLERVAEDYPTGTIAIITHAEPIRAALLYAQGLSLNAWRRFDIPLAAIARVQIDKRGWEVISHEGAQAA